MHRTPGKLALATIIASTLTAGGAALMSGPAFAATSPTAAGITPQEITPGGSAESTSYRTITERGLETVNLPVSVPMGFTGTITGMPSAMTITGMPEITTTITMPRLSGTAVMA